MEWIASLVSGRNFDASDDGGTSPPNKQGLSDEEQYQAVVEKVKNLYETPRDEHGRMIREDLLKNIENLFDKSLVHTVEGEDPVDYDGYVKEMEQFCRVEDLELRFFRYKQVHSGLIDEYVLWGTKHNDWQIMGKFYYNSNLMIYKAEIKRIVTKRVSGQVTAKADAIISEVKPVNDQEKAKDKPQNGKQRSPNSKNIPNSQSSSLSERDFGRKVHELPSIVQHKLLNARGEETDILPTMLSYEFLRIHMEVCTDKTPLKFRRSHRIELKDANGHPYAGGAYFQYQRNRLPFSETLTLFSGGTQGREPEAVAFCEKKNSYFTIYGTKPLRPSSEGHVQMQNCRSSSSTSESVVAFYPWFRLSKGAGSDVDQFGFISILADSEDTLLSNKDYYEPLYILEGTKEHKLPVAFLREYDDNSMQPLSVMKFNSENPKKKHSEKVEVMIAPGVDPTMVLCIVASCLHIDQ